MSRERGKAAVRQVKSLSDLDFDWLRTAFPETYLQMLRLRFNLTNMSAPRTWLAANCKGFYHVMGSSIVSFELEDDALLFKTAHDGV